MSTQESASERLQEIRDRQLEYLREAVANTVGYVLTGDADADDAELIDRLGDLSQQRDELHQQCCQMADAAGERESIAALVADRDEMTVYLKVEALVAEAEAQRDELQRQITMQVLPVVRGVGTDNQPPEFGEK